MARCIFGRGLVHSRLNADLNELYLFHGSNPAGVLGIGDWENLQVVSWVMKDELGLAAREGSRTSRNRFLIFCWLSSLYWMILNYHCRGIMLSMYIYTCPKYSKIFPEGSIYRSIYPNRWWRTILSYDFVGNHASKVWQNPIESIY